MMTELECVIRDKFHKRYAVFTGNGTTAMYLAFQALRMQGKKVLYPAISCTNPVNAAIYAGYNVDFCDINLDDYTIDIEKLKRMLQTEQYGILVATHIYGHRYNEKIIRDLCNRYHIILFEDAAQSFYISGDADLSVMSFGHTKVCDTPLGGGVILTDDAELAQAIADKRILLPDKAILPDTLFDEYRKRYYAITKASLPWEVRNQKLRDLQMESKKYFIYDLHENPVILKELKKIEETVEIRRQKAMLYEDQLNKAYVVQPKKKDSFCWRYTFLYKGNQEYLLEQARKKDIDISSWYLSLAGIYKNEHKPNADKLEKSVINLWVDSTHTETQIQKEIGQLNRIMEEDHAR